MKYIIDIPNGVLWIQYVMQTPSGTQNLKSESVLQLEEYTEPDRKAIDLQHAHDIENVARMNYSKGAEDAWEFVNTLYGLSDEELYEIFDDGNYCEHSYQEAKAKYEEWKKQKELRIGDEVILPDETKGIVMGRDDDDCVVINKDSYTIVYHVSELRNTGRHYDCIINLAEVLKRYRDAV